jgi:Zn-finger nucleic acid-binding protein
MICPVDKTEMRRVKIMSHYGQPIYLDQCERCGGIWFDEAELFQARQGEAGKIEVLDTNILKNPSIIKHAKLICPRDQTALYRFTDKYFPKDIILERCPTCKGIWLNRGVFTKYQKFRQELKRPKEKSSEDKKLEESVRQLIEAYHSEHTTGTVGRMEKFLSTPVEPEEGTGHSLNTTMMILRAFIPFPLPF